MRIVGGELRGRTLFSFDGQDIRPTPDKVRQAVFNIISPRIRGARFMDLFSGTGAMGIEALSRGAKLVAFNDIEKKSVELIKKNLDKLKITENIEIYNQDGVKLMQSGRQVYDVIYIDPPYKAGLNRIAVSSAIFSLSDGGVIILESETDFEQEIAGLKIIDRRKYGRVRLTFFEKGE